jgi:LytTr DNA-binding domain
MTMREMSRGTAPDWRTVVPVLGVGLGAGLFLGLIGPFGTYESLYTGWRLVYWVSLMLCGTLFFPVAYMVVRQTLQVRGVTPFFYVPLVAILGAIPMMIVVIGVTAAMFQEAMSFRFDNYLRVVAISLPMVLLQHLVTEWKELRLAHQTAPVLPAPEPVSTPTETTRVAPDTVIPRLPRLFARLPGRLGTEILCLQMEDHYVRVHTALGQEMILMRMRDAIAELDGLEGLLVHRSWWVARDSVKNWVRDGKSLSLILQNNLSIPVARDRMTEVKTAGWLR